MAQETILITGATGHLGYRTLIILLQQGYRACVTHRRPEQVDKLKKPAAIQPYLGAVEFVLVPDITAPDAYDHVIQGVDGILHIASPIYTGFSDDDTDWQKLLYEPAEKGTSNILQAALTEPRVKRVVITSSIVVLEPKNGSDRAGPYDLRELPDAETLHSAPASNLAYLYSKVLSHHLATDFAKKHNAFDIVRVLPGYIQGAHDLYTSAAEMRDQKRNGSNEGVMNTALNSAKDSPRVAVQVWLDDVARAHVLALRPDVATSGDNLVVVGNGGDSIPWSQFVPVIEQLFPDAVKKGLLTPGTKGEDNLLYYDVTSSEKALGFKFAGAEEMVKSLVGQFVSLAEAA